MKIKELLESEILSQEEQNQFRKELDIFADQVKTKLGLEEFDLSPTRQGDIRLDLIQVPRAKHGRGIGSQAMQLLNDYADSLGKRIVLATADRDPRTGTTSKARLKRFYKGHDFVEKKGRNMDYQMSIYDNMFRRPKPKR